MEFIIWLLWAGLTIWFLFIMVGVIGMIASAIWSGGVWIVHKVKGS